MFQEWEMGVVDLVKLKGNFYLFYEIIFSLFSEYRELEDGQSLEGGGAHVSL